MLLLWAVVGWSIYASYQWRLHKDWGTKADRIAQRLDRALSDTQSQLGVLAESLASRIKDTGVDHLPDISRDTLLKRLFVSEVTLHHGQESTPIFSLSRPVAPYIWRATLYDFVRTHAPQAGLEVTEYGPRVLDIEPLSVGTQTYGVEVAVNLDTFLTNFGKREGVELAFLTPTSSSQIADCPTVETSPGQTYSILASSHPEAADILSSLPLKKDIGRPLHGICRTDDAAYAVLMIDDVEYHPTTVASVSTGSSLIIWMDYTSAVAEVTQEMRQTLWLVSLLIIIFGGLGVFLFVRYRGRIQRRINFFKDALYAANQSLRAEAHARQQIEERLRGIADEMYTNRENDMRLLALLAHQLKLNASATVGFAEILDDEKSGTKDHESIDALRQLGERLFLMAENIDLWARRDILIHSSNIHPQPLKAFMERAVESLKQMSERKKISVRVNFEENLIVNADTLILEVTLKNILSNAIKFSPHEGEVTVTGRRLSDSIELSIIDNGQGISRVIMEKLFEPNSDKVMRGTAGEEGLGLGLLIVRWACKIQKIQLRVTSDEGQGCRVVLTFPVSAAIAADAGLRTK